MKIAFVSFTGKVGKSSLCNTLAYPHMPEATIIRMETINDSGLAGAKKEIIIKGGNMAQLELELAKVKDAIVDVGASNIESFMHALNSQYESHLALDFFVVPVKADARAQSEMGETMKTIQALNVIGIEPDRIKVVFNRLAPNEDVEEECKSLFNFHKKMPIFTINPNAVIHETEAFSTLTLVKKPYLEMLSDTRNYRKEMDLIPLENEKERTNMVKWIRAQGTVKVLDREMKAAWSALFGELA